MKKSRRKKKPRALTDKERAEMSRTHWDLHHGSGYMENDHDPVTVKVIETLNHTNPFVPSSASKTPMVDTTSPLIWEAAEGDILQETSDKWVESAVIPNNSSNRSDISLGTVTMMTSTMTLTPEIHGHFQIGIPTNTTHTNKNI